MHRARPPLPPDCAWRDLLIPGPLISFCPILLSVSCSERSINPLAALPSAAGSKGPCVLISREAIRGLFTGFIRHTHTHTGALTETCTNRSTHAHTHARPVPFPTHNYKIVRKNARNRTPTHTQKHTHTHTHRSTHTHKSTHKHRSTCTHTHTHTGGRTNRSTHTHIEAHTIRSAHTHTHTHRRTHTHRSTHSEGRGGQRSGVKIPIGDGPWNVEHERKKPIICW